MRKDLIRRSLWIAGLVLLFAVGMAAAQEQDQPSQDQPSSDVPTSSSSETDAAFPDATASPGTDDTSNAMSADLYSASSPYSGLPPLGTPAPIQAPNSELHLGPFYLTGVSESVYYSTVNPQNGNHTSFWGDNIEAGVVLSEKIGKNGALSFHASPQVLFASGRTWFNDTNGLAFNYQVNDRWTLLASTQLAYFQNSILTNPQYALVNTSGGYVLQTLYLQTIQPAFYYYSNFSAAYRLGTKTTLSISPTIGFSMAEVSGPLVLAHSFGGTVSVAHQYSERGSVSVFYGFAQSTTSNTPAPGSSSWNSSSFGVGISQGLAGETWSLAFNVAANAQQNSSANFSAIGNVALIKKLPQGSISANYSRSEATLLLASPGYFDQGSISYNRNFGEKLGTNIGVGAYRSSQTVSNDAHGVRLSGSIFYQWLPSLNMTAGFFLGQQAGANGNSLQLFNGRSNTFDVGLYWTPGRTQSSVTPPTVWGSSNPGF